jgi:hypothetical protein
MEIVKGHSVAWLMSILASIYGICKVSLAGDTKSYSAEECMKQIEYHIHYDFRDSKNSAHSWEAYRKFTACFQPVFLEVMFELLSVILNPFLFIVVIPMKAASIVDFVIQNSTQQGELGWICSFSVFDERQMNQTKPQEQKVKYLRSISHFQKVCSCGKSTSDPVDECERFLLIGPEPPLLQTTFTSLAEVGSSDVLDHDGGPLVL